MDCEDLMNELSFSHRESNTSQDSTTSPRRRVQFHDNIKVIENLDDPRSYDELIRSFYQPHEYARIESEITYMLSFCNFTYMRGLERRFVPGLDADVKHEIEKVRRNVFSEQNRQSAYFVFHRKGTDRFLQRLRNASMRVSGEAQQRAWKTAIWDAACLNESVRIVSKKTDVIYVPQTELPMNIDEALGVPNTTPTTDNTRKFSLSTPAA